MIRDLLASPLGSRFELEAIPTYRGASPLRRLGTFLLALVRLIGWSLRGGRRVVHVHTAVRGSLYRKAVVVRLAKALGCRVLLHLHAGAGDIAAFDARIGRLARAMFRGAFAASDRVLSVSAAGAREIEARFGAEDVLVVPNSAPFVDAQERAAGTDDEGAGMSILYMGGFVDPAKGGRVLVEALSWLVERCPEARVTLAGPGEPPLEADEVLRSEAATWAGWLDPGAKERLLCSADVFVLPSFSEGLPVALLEAMAHARPIVATAVGGIPDVIDDGREALLVPPGDPRSLAEAIASLAENPERRRALGEAARERARRLNDREVFAPLEALYEEVSP